MRDGAGRRSNRDRTASQCASRPATVPPIIRGTARDFPDEVTVLVNRTTRLECPADGNPPPKISWFQDSQPVASDGPRRILSNGQILQVKLRSHPQMFVFVVRLALNYRLAMEPPPPPSLPPTVRFRRLRCPTRDGMCVWLRMWPEVQKNLLTSTFTVRLTSMFAI